MSLVAVQHVSFPSKGLVMLALQKLAVSLTEDIFQASECPSQGEEPSVEARKGVMMIYLLMSQDVN